MPVKPISCANRVPLEYLRVISGEKVMTPVGRLSEMISSTTSLDTCRLSTSCDRSVRATLLYTSS